MFVDFGGVERTESTWNCRRMAEATSTDVDLPANVFKAKISYDIAYETIDGVKTPRVVQPDFSIDGFDFHLFTQSRDSKICPYAMFVELTETSKKTLLDGYEIKFTTFSTCDVAEDGERSTWTRSDPVSVGSDAALVYKFDSEIHCDVEIVAEFQDVYPHRLEFVDADEAKKNRSDCKVVLVDDGKKEVFVNKDVLAMRSPFFNTMFFGDFKEKDQDEVTLSGVKQKAFLEYLCCVYPPPNRLFAFKRLEALLRLSDRFQNDSLISSIEKFLAEKKGKTCDEKRQTLILSDAYNMPALFRGTLKTMNKTEMKALSPAACKAFKPDNVELLVAHIHGLW